MATKKQKRLAALAKREKFMADYRREGLEAQRRDREERARQARKAAEKACRKAAEEAAKNGDHSIEALFTELMEAHDRAHGTAGENKWTGPTKTRPRRSSSRTSTRTRKKRETSS